MAGIGFELRRLTQRDDLMGAVQGYVHSALVSSGPWLFTVIAIAAINLFSQSWASPSELADFRIAIIYSFSFSLVLTGPVMLVATRYLADKIYGASVEQAPGMMLGAFLVVFVTQAPIVFWFYGSYVELPNDIRAAAIANYFLVTGVWIVSIFLTALKDFRSITRAFGAGMIIAFLSSMFLGQWFGAPGLLNGFNFGLATIMFSLIARVFAEYPYPITKPFEFLGHGRKYWDLALTGIVYNMAAWVDKWIMWFVPEREELPSGMISYPNYDGAMFLAYLTIVPAMAVFIVNLETRFFEAYQKFYRDIQGHAVLERIHENHQTIVETLKESARNVTVLQACVAFLAVLTAPQLFQWAGVSMFQIGMFRIGVLGAFCHVLLLFLTIVLSYFDLRRKMLYVSCVFLVTNAVFTYITAKMGFAYYGYGYFLSCLVTLLYAYALTAREVLRLPYLSFVLSNASVR
jgi:polysaccharide biosynthesis protein PelG